MSNLSKLILALSLSLISLTANAAVIIDTGTPNNAYWTINNLSTFAYSQYGAIGAGISFTESYNITDISSYFNSAGYPSPGYAGTVGVSLYTDNSGIPGSQLYSQSFSFPSPSNTDTWAGLSGINWQVTTGNYWLTYEASDGLTTRIYKSSTSLPVAYKYSVDSSWVSVGNNPFSLVISGNSTAPVPESDTLAMLLTGLSLIGFMARRRKNNQV